MKIISLLLIAVALLLATLPAHAEHWMRWSLEANGTAIYYDNDSFVTGSGHVGFTIRTVNPAGAAEGSMLIDCATMTALLVSTIEADGKPQPSRMKPERIQNNGSLLNAVTKQYCPNA